MKFSLYLLIFSIGLFIGFNASAGVCTGRITNNTNTAMTATGQMASWEAQGGCTAVAADTYVIPTGSTVVIGGTVPMAGLKVDGGTLILAPSTTLNMTGPLELNGVAGGNFIAYPQIRTITRASSWGVSATNGSQTLVLDTDAAALGVVAGDEIQILDEDGEDLESPITKPIFIGPGKAPPGSYRPSFNKWRIYNVISASGSTITHEINEFTGSLGLGAITSGIYQGRRLPVTTITPTAATYLSNHFQTIYTIPDGTVNVHADLGSWYVEWLAGPCTGLVSKIVSTVLDASASDYLHVAGDASIPVCGLSAFKLTQGQRPGDLVKIMKMPTINFQDSAGGNIRWDISKVQMNADGLKILRPKESQFSVISGGSSSEYFNFVMYDSRSSCLTGTNYAYQSSFTNGEIAFTKGGEANSDTSVVGVYSMGTAGLVPVGGSGGCKTDMTGFTWARNYIHDQINNPAQVSGNHGIFHRAAHFAKFTKTRIERMGDDLFGASSDPLGLTQPNDRVEFYHIIGEEQHPDHDMSDQCIDLQAKINGTEGFNNLKRSTWKVNEAFLTGCGTNTIGMTVASGNFSNFFVGSSDNGSNSGELSMAVGVTSSSAASDLIDSYPNSLDNFIMMPEGNPTNGGDGDNDALIKVGGSLSNSILLNPYTVDGFKVVATTKVSNTLIDATGNYAGAWMTYPNPAIGGQRMSYENSVILCDTCPLFAAGEVAASQSAKGGPYLSFIDSVIAFGTLDTGAGLTGSGFQQSYQVGKVSVNGLILTSTATNGTSIGNYQANTLNGANVNRMCARTTNPVGGHYGYVSHSLTTGTEVNNPGVYHVAQLSPLANVPTQRPGAYVETSQVGPCASYYPDAVGLSERSYSMAMLGDLVNNDWASYSSRPDPTGTTSAGGRSVSW